MGKVLSDNVHSVSECESDVRTSGRGGMADRRRLLVAVAVAAVLWFFMFSPWTGHLVNFWVCMSASAVVLTTLAITGSDSAVRDRISAKNIAVQLFAGIAIAFALWGVFWVGDKVSQLMFPFARPQVDDVYGMKEGTPPVLISLLLLFVIGPAEEYFWRGYVQKKISDLHGCNVALFATAAVYALVHIWSFNFMLVMAALVAGGVWGLIYKLKPSLLPALVVSHAVWDALVFVVLPI